MKHNITKRLRAKRLLALALSLLLVLGAMPLSASAAVVETTPPSFTITLADASQCAFHHGDNLDDFDPQNGHMGGSGGNLTRTCTYGEGYVLPAATAAPTGSGEQVFCGWYTAATGGELVTSGTAFLSEEEQTLYAHWGGSDQHVYTMNPGNYYLSKEFTFTGTIQINEGTVNLCLMGHSITDTPGRFISSLFDVKDGGTVTIPAGEKIDPADYHVPDQNPSSGGSTYPPVIEQLGRGEIAVSPARPKVGVKVTITVTPADGFEPGTVTATDSNGKPVAVTKNPDGTYTYIQPEGKVTISVYMGLACPKDDTCPIHAFSDASTTAWYHDGVHYCIENGLMTGYGNGKFGPNNTLTRGMLAQILYNKGNRPEVTGPSPFEDVKEGAWYAVIWAAENDIVAGYGNGRYGPNDPITREQLAMILWRYAGSPESTGRDRPHLPPDCLSACRGKRQCEQTYYRHRAVCVVLFLTDRGTPAFWFCPGSATLAQVFPIRCPFLFPFVSHHCNTCSQAEEHRHGYLTA